MSWATYYTPKQERRIMKEKQKPMSAEEKRMYGEYRRDMEASGITPRGGNDWVRLYRERQQAKARKE